MALFVLKKTTTTTTTNKHTVKFVQIQVNMANKKNRLKFTEMLINQ